MGKQPSVVAMGEIGEMLGLSRGRIAVLVTRADFPAPIAHLTVSRIWAYEEVKAWATGTGRAIHSIAAH